MKEGERIAVKMPEWLKEENDDVFSVVMAIFFDWAFTGEKEVKNFRKELSETFDDTSEEDLDRVYELLLQHHVIAPDSTAE